MKNTICINEKFSTTRLLLNNESLIKNEGNVFNRFEGGLLTKGHSKLSYKDKPLISIITVVYNGKFHIEETILSTITQTYDNVEYIIIDGGSNDGTLEIIKKYEDMIDYFVSEKDKGIYDAMNKAINIVNGKWINFMNAGDSFYNCNTLKNVFENEKYNNVDIIYGNHNVIYESKTRIVNAGNIIDIWKGSQFCHQATFIRSKIHKENKFNISNRIGADFEFFYTLYKKDKTFKSIDLIVANYSAGGLSDVNRIDSIVGIWNIIEKNTKINLYYIWIILKEMIKAKIKRIIKKLRGAL